MLVSHIGKRSKAPEKKPPGQKPPDNKLPRIIEKIVAKYDFDANLFWLGSTNLNFFFKPSEKNQEVKKKLKREAHCSQKDRVGAGSDL